MSSTLASSRSFGRLETQGEPTAVAGFGFAIDQQAETFVKIQAEALVAFDLLAQAEAHAEQAQRVELVERLVVEPGRSGGGLDRP